MFDEFFLYNYTDDIFTAMDTNQDYSIDLDEFLVW